MKERTGKRQAVLSALATAVIILTVFSGIAFPGVWGSKHDLSVNDGTPFAFLTYQICVFCHTPHGANRSIRTSVIFNGPGDGSGSYKNAAAPSSEAFLLWNRSLPTATQFSVYKSSTLDVNVSEIRIYSLLCLSCHDGVSAMNVLTSYPSETDEFGYQPTEPLEPKTPGGDTYFAVVSNGSTTTGWGPNIGDRVNVNDKINLSNDHPISFDYPAAADGHPDVTAGGLVARDSGSWNADLRLFPSPYDGVRKSMECSTCHDPHDNSRGEDFLATDNTGSAMCLSCHNK